MSFASVNFSLLFSVGLLILVVLVFIRISRSLRKGGGSMTTVSLGATDQFYNREKKEVAAEIVNRKANKKIEEQESDEGKEKKPDNSPI